MAFRLTILLVLAILGTMYFAPDPGPGAAPRADRAADPAPVPQPTPDSAQPTPESAQPTPESAQPTPDPAPPTAQPAPPPVAPAPTPDRGETVRVGPPDGDDLPTVTALPGATRDGSGTGPGPVALPGIGFGDPGGDTAAALSLSDAARNRAAQATADALANAPDNPLSQGVSQAANDLLRGLVATEPAATGPTVIRPAPVPADAGPRPTDPTPPPAGDIARVTGTTVNLRAGPSTANDVVGQVTFGQTLRVLDPDRDGWATVENPVTGDRAFIASQFLEILP